MVGPDPANTTLATLRNGVGSWREPPNQCRHFSHSQYGYRDTRMRCCFEKDIYFTRIRIKLYKIPLQLKKQFLQVLMFSLIEDLREVDVLVSRLNPEHMDPLSNLFFHNTCFYRLSRTLQSYPVVLPPIICLIFTTLPYSSLGLWTHQAEKIGGQADDQQTTQKICAQTKPCCLSYSIRYSTSHLTTKDLLVAWLNLVFFKVVHNIKFK